MRKRIALGMMVVFLMMWGLNLCAQPVQYNHPELDWYTIDTKHFQVHYHDGTERTAALVAKIAEDIYWPITSLYLYEPDGKIHFIIRDHDDYSNGGAYYYDNKVEIWASPMDFALRGSHNWLRNVVTHEFSHMISLGAARKITRSIPAFYVQYIDYEPEKNPYVLYGFPNRIVSYPIAMTTVPNWLAEGVAQFQLPKFNYDNWDTHRDMILRTAVLENEMLSYKEMGVFGKNSIGNEKVYNQGYALTRYIADTYGVESVRRIIREMQRPWNMTVDGALKQVIGKSEKQLYKEWKSYLQKMYSYRVNTIKENLRTGIIVEQKGFYNLSPVWSPDGKKVAFISNRGFDYGSQTSLYIKNYLTAETKKIKGSVFSTLSWSPDGENIVYARHSKPDKNGSHYYDIYTYNLKTKKERQITKSVRAQNPDWSPDGENLVFVTMKDGTQNIAVLNIKSKEMKYLTKFTEGQQVFQPRWSPNGKVIVFSFTKGEGRQLGLLTADGKTMSVLIDDGNDARDPVFASNGKEVLFSWDRTGIFNIYSINIFTKQKAQLTNVIGGAFMPTVNKEGQLLYSDFSAKGYRITRMDKLSPVKENNSEYAEYKSKVHLASSDNNDIAMINQGISQESINYNDTELPKYNANPYHLTYSKVAFLPRVTFDYGTTKIGSYFYAGDVLDKYNIFGGFAVNKDLDYDVFAILNYNKFKPTIFLEIYNQVRHHSSWEDIELDDGTVNSDIDFKYDLTEVDMGLEFRLSDQMSIRPTYIFSLYKARMEPNYSLNGMKIFSALKYRYFIGNNFQLALNYSAVLPTMTSEINPSVGRKFSIKYSREYNKFINDFELTSYGTYTELFDNYNYGKFEVDWSEYIRPWYHNRHALNLHFQGGWIDKEVDEFFNFFAGGLVGLRGYPYYSIEGRKMAIASATYRFPLFNNLDKRFLHLYFDKLYAGVFMDYGDAFDAYEIHPTTFKKDVGFELRLDMFSFYNFPTRVFFNAAYGLDEVNKIEKNSNIELNYGKEWRYYVGVTFGYFD